MAASTTALVHTGSKNVSDKTRKLLFVSYTAGGISLRFNVDREDKRIDFLKALRENLRPERR